LGDVAARLSVIIPTLNAGRHLEPTLAALGTAILEVIVVDGGSTDDTVGIAKRRGARVIVAPRGRGHQIAEGVGAAQGELLLLLHADTCLGPTWPEAVEDLMRDPGRAGYFRFALDVGSAAARRLERLVAWRCRWLALPYGDQGLVVSSALLAAIGGVRPLPLMEDVDLVRRIGPARLAPLAVAATTSAERWQRDGWLRRSSRNLACLGLYFLGVPPRLIARLYG
jgi:rSAM/selenodomain-associated transferase 2